MTEDTQTFDIAVSFAGAQRHLVEPVVRACERLGLRVFYDKDLTVEFWGRNFIYSMREVYGGARARYFVPFFSQEYLASAYPMDEFNTAVVRAIEIAADSYILPIVVGSVEIPATVLSPAIGYLRLEDYTADRLAEVIAKRVGAAHERHQEARQAEDVLQIRLPRLPTADFSTYETLEKALVRVGELFQQAADQLMPFGMRCLVRKFDSEVNVRVERLGSPVCGLALRFDNSFSDDRLVMAFAWPRITGDAVNGWITAAWDPPARRSALRFVDMGTREVVVTADELFHLLWAKIVDYLEQTA
ncbi:MAG: toll/interleukin-1 receptor domain-containing protein [Umezawaea sp.]